MTFTAQQLQHRIELQRFTEVVNSYGERETFWSTFAEPFARIDPLAGREFFAAAAVQAEQTVKFTLRWRDDVLPADRIVWKGDAYNITAVLNIGTHNRELLIHATKE